LSLHCELIIS